VADTVENVIEKVVSYAKNQLPENKKNELIIKFIRLYYTNIAFEDIGEHSIPDLYGAVLSHWELMQRRKPKEVKTRIFNPNYEENGWQSTHTIIQIVTDDMPFLIDSIRMEVNRLGLTTHLLIYIGGI